jgi:hypothetical protein
VGVLLLAVMAISGALGVARLIRCLRGEFDLLSALAFGALVLVFVIVMYTGIFLAGFVLS